MQPENRCKAHKRNGERCGNPPMQGGTVCRMHGGASPRAREAAQRNIERQAAEKAVAALGLYRVIDPADALLEEVHRAAGLVSWYEQRLKDMDPEELFWGRRSHEHGITPEGMIDKTTDAATVHVVYDLYLTERAALVRASEEALRAGIAERQVALAEHQALQVAGLIRRILTRAPLTPEQRAAMDVVVVEELQAIEGA